MKHIARLFAAAALATAPVAITSANPAVPANLTASYGKLPLSFELNAGQTDARVKFLSRGPGYALFLTGNEAVLSLGKAHRADAIRMSLAGANRNARVTGLDELPGKSNYFIGNDPAKWRTNVPTYAKVKYQDVYRGIDVVYYGNPQQLEYDFLVAPGADPKAISLNVTAGVGKSQLHIGADGDLVIQAGEDEVRLHKPVVYQAGEGSARHFLDGHYLLTGNQVSFEIGSYDPGRQLVIDPVLVYSTFLGGSDIDQGYGIAVDSSGNAYVTGQTLSTNFPTARPLQPLCGGGCDSFASSPGDAFVAKLNPAGSALVYSTYLGGSLGEEGTAIAVDSSGSAYVTGGTSSTDFPTAHPLQVLCSDCNQPGGLDAFVAKLSPAGSALVYSTYLGGIGVDQGLGIAVDSTGNAYVTGGTASNNFPTASPIQDLCAGGHCGQRIYNAFVAKLNSAGSALVYSTYLGGSQEDVGFGIAVDSSGNAYVTGLQGSPDFPGSPVQGSMDHRGFVTKLNPAGSAFIYSSYFGGVSNAIAVDSAGNAYVTGYVISQINFPTINAPQASFGGGVDDAFVAKLNTAGTAFVYSTYLGGSDMDVGNGIAVDASGDAYVTGYTESSNFPTVNPLQAALGGTANGLQNPFVTKLNPAGSAFVYSSYLGGSGGDSASGIAVDSSGNAYITGFATSTDFPTANPLQASLRGTVNAFIAKINGIAGPSCQLTSVIAGPPKQLQITMQDAGSGLQSVQLVSSINSTVNIPTFTIGSKNPLVVVATKQDQSQGSEVTFKVTNMAGAFTSCDPVDFTAQIENRMETHVFRSLSSSEHYVRILNGKPGLRHIAFRVNGELLPELRLGNGEAHVFDISSAMHEGSNNVVLLQASGKSGASAYILIGDDSIK